MGSVKNLSQVPLAMENTADYIVKEARKKTSFKGDKKLRSSISGYAAMSNVEAIAEAYADVYCNGKNAKSASRAIMSIVDSFY